MFTANASQACQVKDGAIKQDGWNTYLIYDRPSLKTVVRNVIVVLCNVCMHLYVVIVRVDLFARRRLNQRRYSQRIGSYTIRVLLRR